MFLLYANCIPVRGAARSVICDLEKGRLRYIPNLLFDVLEKAQTLSIDQLKLHFGHEYDEGIDSYFSLLEEEGFGHFTGSLGSFPPLFLEKQVAPGLVQNAMLELEWPLQYDLENALEKLMEMGCKALSIVVEGVFPKEQFYNILEALRKSRLRYLELFIPFEMGYLDEEVWKMLRQHPRLQRFEIYDTMFEQIVHHDNMALKGRFKKIKGSPFKSGVSFAPNLDAFAEAKIYNLALNRRICIDKMGFVRNDLTHQKHFNHVSKIDLFEITKNPEFTKAWHFQNDQILRCSDCEHRYVCVDFSEIVWDEAFSSLRKTNDCGYNPHSGSWKSRDI